MDIGLSHPACPEGLPLSTNPFHFKPNKKEKQVDDG
jgi:hypothetical protein